MFECVDLCCGWGKYGVSYLFVVFFQQSGGQVCCSTQLILEDKSAALRAGHTLSNSSTLLILCLCEWVSVCVCTCVPVHHKSSAWPDTVVCSSWRWLQCPPQKLPAETVSANKNHQKQTNKHHAADLTTWSVFETTLSLLAPDYFLCKCQKLHPDPFLQIKHLHPLLLLSRCVLTSCWSLSFSRH